MNEVDIGVKAIEGRLAEAEECERRASSRVGELREALAAAKSLEPAAHTLEARLEVLPWNEAASGKCDYVRNAPGDLVEAVRASKYVNGASHNFTASPTEASLFRFKRRRT